MTQALNLANFANNLNTSGATSNAGLQNSAVTVTAGTAMSGGGSVSLGGSVTLNNAGVTSLVAGTGISISGSTGAVTVTSTVSGGVSSVNGQTGAVVLTNASDIGSVSIFINATNSDLAYSSTRAGSDLRYNFTATAGSAGLGTGYVNRNGNSSYNGGGTSLSGTWRKLNTGQAYRFQANCCGGSYDWFQCLFIRVS
jgi:hypothetical protein